METAITQPKNEKATTVTSLTFLPTLVKVTARSAPIAGNIHVNHGATTVFQNIVSVLSHSNFLRRLMT
jgi:hypothetical protein